MSRKKKYTIQDIARELNTSISTVSRALKDHPRISAEMCERVKKFALEHDYQPDFRASSLRMGSNRTIGVLVPRVDMNFFARVLRGIDEICSVENYNVMICQSFDSLQKEMKLVKSLLHGKVDGLIASISIETHDGDHFKSLLDKGLPLVFFDKVLESLNVHKVVVDDYKGAYESVEHLIRNGYKRIAHFAGPQHHNIYRHRTLGYLEALKENGFEIDEEIIFHDTVVQETGYKTLKKIHEMKNPPDAIFSSSDYAILGAIVYCKKHGIEIPKQLGLTGFANEPFDDLYGPSITSVEQHPIVMGQKAARLLIDVMEKKNKSTEPQIVKLDPTLIVRQSSSRLTLTKEHSDEEIEIILKKAF